MISVQSICKWLGDFTMSYFKPVSIDPDLADIVPIFVENTEVSVEELASLYATADYEGMGKICHKILGTAASYGFPQLEEIVLELRAAIKSGRYTDIPECLKSCDEYVGYMKSLNLDSAA